jgi:DNA polymerase-3 subunit alpha
MVYQEQVQRAANVLAGYSLGGADLLRRAMGKKIVEEMAKERVKFIEGCKKTNNIPEKTAADIFNNIEKFAGYGFNKAHSAGYAILCNQTAYLKAHYPVEYMCAFLTSEIGNADEYPGELNETIASGIAILPPDVNRSHPRFVPEGGAIRYGLTGIKGLGEAAAGAIVDERKANGPYVSMVDFCVRTAPQNKRQLEALSRAGAFDSLVPDRAQACCAADFAIARAASILEERASGQASLFGDSPSAGGNSDDLPQPPSPWTEREKLNAEREVLGVFLSGHPLHQHSRLAKDFQTATLAKIGELADNTDVRVIGLLASVQQRLTKEKKEPWALLQLDDGNTTLEALMFPEAFRKFQNAAVQDQPVLVCGRVSKRDEETKIIVQELHPLEDAPRLFASCAVISIGGAQSEKLDALHRLVKDNPGGVRLVVRYVPEGGSPRLIAPSTQYHVFPAPKFLRDLDALLGRGAIRFAAAALTTTRKRY